MRINWHLLDELASKYGESFYLLDSEKFETNYDEFLGAFRDIYPKTFIAYSYKTNYIPKLCALIDHKGGYAEVVSEMEFLLAMKLGVSPTKIIFNGPYKNEAAIEKCLLNGGVVNLDSFYEIDIVEKIAQNNPEICISIGLRCNFDIGNSSTSRFGFDVGQESFNKIFIRLEKINNLCIKGIHCHFPNRDLESYITRVDKMLTLSNQLFSSPPEFINLGGGYFGKVDESLGNQFKCEVPSYHEYADVIATKFRNFYSGLDEASKPILFLEPGTALVADAMKFVVRVTSIKKIRSKSIATVSGSKFNIMPTSSEINVPMNVYSNLDKNCDDIQYDSIDISGYTCIENDYLYKGYTGSLNVGDYIVFDNVGSYSIVLKPPFILPNSAIIEYNSKTEQYETIKRREEFEDVFRTFNF